MVIACVRARLLTADGKRRWMWKRGEVRREGQHEEEERKPLISLPLSEKQEKNRKHCDVCVHVVERFARGQERYSGRPTLAPSISVK